MIGISTRITSKEHHAKLLENIDRWTFFFPHEKIVVVDSASPDKSYFEPLQQLSDNIIIEDIDNAGYEAGAWWYIFDKYPDNKMYYFFQDSMLLADKITDFIPKDENDVAVCCEHENELNAPCVGWGGDPPAMNWARDQQDKCQYTDLLMDDGTFDLAVHSSFIIHRATLEKVKAKGLDKIIIDCKFGSRAFERIWGPAFFHYEKFNKIVIPGTHVRKWHGNRDD